MYSIGEVVSYATQGVCKISDVTVRRVAGEDRQYYVLTPVHDERSTVYVPTDSEKLLANMRTVLSADEINGLIDDLRNSDNEWINDDIARKEFCHEVVKSGDRGQLIKLVDMLYVHQKDLKTQKKHFHVSDERYLREAERLLHDEIAFVLGISVEKVPTYIRARLNINKPKKANK